MLRWMIFEGEITPYFTAGRIVPRSMLAAILDSEGIDLSSSLAERDKAVRARWNDEYWPRMVGHRITDYVEDDPIEWNVSDEPHAVGAGFFVFAEDVDWEMGQLSADIGAPNLGDFEHLFWDEEEHLASMFSKAEYRATFSGMCFSWGVIEMLQPGAEIQSVTSPTQVASAGRIGRPRTWNWEGALTHLLGLAQHPDGLPTGAGAQAQVERLIAEWFVETTGNSPAPSQIRNWAQKVMRALKSPES